MPVIFVIEARKEYMKTRLLVSFLVASVLSLGVAGVVYGADIARALTIESQRYGGINPRYLLVAVGAVVFSYLFGYLSTKSKLV